MPKSERQCGGDGLALWPKFAVKLPTTAPEKLSLVRKVSSLAPASEVDWCVSSGVDILLWDQCDPGRPAINRLASYLKTNAYCLLPSDKEGGFAIFPREIYNVKALKVLSSVFHCHNNVSLNKLKYEPKKLCEKNEPVKIS